MAKSENTSTSRQPPASAKDKTPERSGQTKTSSPEWPKDWIDKTAGRSGETLTIIGAPRPNKAGAA